MKIQKKLGAAVLSLGLVVGLSGFAGATTGTIDTTGPDSDNTIHSESSHEVEVENKNELEVRNDNDQRAYTGDAKATHSTNAGDADTGDAANANNFTAMIEVDNSNSVPAAVGGGSGGGNHSATIRDTGPDSDNHVVFKEWSSVEIENKNDLYVHNTNDQKATSGDATVSNTTNGGSASTGNASNTNSTSVTYRVTN